MLKNSGGNQSLGKENASASWLALVIGNSRLHWAWFVGKTPQMVWDMPHLPPEIVGCLLQHQLYFSGCIELLAQEQPELPSDLWALLSQIPPRLPLWVASVIPEQTQCWQAYSQTHMITLDQIPIRNLYATLGIDRALALLGAVTQYGLPSLVIDAGTALTFTGVDQTRQLVGGAILPGLQLQLCSLAEHTATLPLLSSAQALPLPPRWTATTTEAIWSGVIYTLLAGIQDFIGNWQQQIAGGSIVLTGGDAALIFALLQQQNPDLAAQIRVDSQIIFRGIQAIAVNQGSIPSAH